MVQVVHKVSKAVVRGRIHAAPEEIAAFCRAHHIRVYADTETLYGDPPEEVTVARANRSLYGRAMVKDEGLSIEDMLDNARHAQRIVSGRTRDLHPGIPWSDVIGMRTVLVHRYGDGDDDVVWKSVSADRAPLIAELERMLPPEMRAEP